MALDFYTAIYQLFDFDDEDTTGLLANLIAKNVHFSDIARNVRPYVVPKSASWQPALSEIGCIYEYNSGSGGNCTLPDDATVAFPIGTEFIVYGIGAGVVTFVAGGTATVQSVGPDLVMGTQFSRTIARKRAASTWIVSYGL